LFKDVSKNGATFLIATHDYRLIEQSDCRVLKVEKGQLMEVNG